MCGAVWGMHRTRRARGVVGTGRARRIGHRAYRRRACDSHSARARRRRSRATLRDSARASAPRVRLSTHTPVTVARTGGVAGPRQDQEGMPKEQARASAVPPLPRRVATGPTPPHTNVNGRGPALGGGTCRNSV
eukprot:1053661-Prymnesium_polylepis.1